jgi:hypothetical protein
MLDTIIARQPNREVWFFYGVRRRPEHAMLEHLKQVDADHPNVHLVVCYSEPTETCVKGEHYTHTGYVSVDLFKTLLPSNNYKFYMCGPPAMMETLTRDLAAWGVPDEDVNLEAFGPASVKRTQEAVAEPAPGTSFEIVFARSNQVRRWSPASGTLLEFGEASGLKMNCGCRSGSCGSCLTAVKEGAVTYVHRPSKSPEAGSCLTCISVPAGRLVIDA